MYKNKIRSRRVKKNIAWPIMQWYLCNGTAIGPVVKIKKQEVQ